MNAICVLPICPMSASGYHFLALLLYCRVLLSSGEEVLHNTVALVFTFGDMILTAATQRKTCDQLVRGACIPGSLETETIQEAVLSSLPPPGHCKDSQLKHTSTFLRKRPICLSYNFSLRGRFLPATHLDYRGPPGTGCHLCTLHLLARALRYLQERSLYTRLEHRFV